MQTKTVQWFKVFDDVNAITWQENSMCVVEVNDTKITLALNKQIIHAFAYKCPHAGGIMSEGFIDAMGNAVCPVHQYRFNLKTGRNYTGEDFLKTYIVELRDSALYIGFEEKTWKF